MWGTASEITFINSLRGTSRMSRLEVLQGYLEGARKRKRWSFIDGKAAIAHAESLIAELSAPIVTRSEAKKDEDEI